MLSAPGSAVSRSRARQGATDMSSIFYIIGVIVVVFFIARYFGLI
jgi:hypothetical protein